MKKLVHSWIAFVLIIGIGACDFSTPGDLGFHTADKKYMQLMEQELESAGINYRIDGEGFIRYPSNEKERVKKIEIKVREILFKLSPGSGGRVRSTDPDYMRLLKEELDSAGIKYEVDNEGFIMYSSADKEQFENIQSKIDKIACASCNDKAKR